VHHLAKKSDEDADRLENGHSRPDDGKHRRESREHTSQPGGSEPAPAGGGVGRASHSSTDEGSSGSGASSGKGSGALTGTGLLVTGGADSGATSATRSGTAGTRSSNNHPVLSTSSSTATHASPIVPGSAATHRFETPPHRPGAPHYN